VLSGLSQDVFFGVCAHLGAATGEDVLASQELSHLNNSPFLIAARRAAYDGCAMDMASSGVSSIP